jgi:hypothetical protein
VTHQRSGSLTYRRFMAVLSQAGAVVDFEKGHKLDLVDDPE